MRTDWTQFFDDEDRRLLTILGEDPDYLPTDYNPVTRALSRDPEGFLQIVERVGSYAGTSQVRINKTKLARLACLCQQVIYDYQGGPEGDRKPKALRRHWYAWFKTDYFQPLADALGEYVQTPRGKERKDRQWDALQSKTLAALVDSGLVTYRDLWIEDASRMSQEFYTDLFRGAHIVICVEKDSLLADFTDVAKAVGAKAIYSGKGKSSKAAVEKLLRDVFYWREDYDPFTEYEPLVFLTISDRDYDGHAVIQDTFGTQARRYTPWVREARIGVDPENIRDAGFSLDDKWYEVKTTNSAYVEWAEEFGCWQIECGGCGKVYNVVGADHTCPNCGDDLTATAATHTAYGFEVEALRSRDYFGLVVQALLEIFDYDYLVEKLRDDCTPDEWEAVETLKREVLDENPDYQALLAEFDRLEKIKEEFERNVEAELSPAVADRLGDYRDLEDDPDIDEFFDHARNARGWEEPWRPFSRSVRTGALIQDVQKDEVDLLDELKGWSITW